jgi:hypothetical protein
MGERVGTIRELDFPNYKIHALLKFLKKQGPVIPYPVLFSLFSTYKIKKKTAWLVLKRLSDEGFVYLSRKYVVVLQDYEETQRGVANE